MLRVVLVQDGGYGAYVFMAVPTAVLRVEGWVVLFCGHSITALVKPGCSHVGTLPCCWEVAYKNNLPS